LTSHYTDGTGNFTIMLSDFLATPFDHASLRADSEIGVGDLWIFTPRNDTTEQNASIEPAEAWLEVVMDTLLAMADSPDGDIFCINDVPCAAAQPDGGTWECNDWAGGDQGVCADDLLGPSCEPSGSDCSGTYCNQDICGLADADLFDFDILEEALDEGSFVNEEVVDSMDGVF